MRRESKGKPAEDGDCFRKMQSLHRQLCNTQKTDNWLKMKKKKDQTWTVTNAAASKECVFQSTASRLMASVVNEQTQKSNKRHFSKQLFN